MRFHKPALALFLSFACSYLQAQILPFEKYTSKDGLLSDRITAIAQDKNGFMWFGSYFGICRYDGVKFEKISLPSIQQNKFVSFIAPAGDKVYAGFLFNGGLAEFENGKAHAYFISNEKGNSNEFTCMYDNEDGSIILANTSNEIYQFSKGKFNYLLTLPQRPGVFPRSIQKDRQGNLWIGTEEGLFIAAYPYHSAKKFFPAELIASLVKTKTGELWFLTSGKDKNKLQACGGLKDNQFINLQNIGPVSPSLIPFTGNTDRGFWFIDHTKKLANISDASGKLNTYEVPLNFNTDISTVFCDRENNIWIANEPGVLKISHFNIRTYLFDELAIAGGALFQKNDSTLWVSNSKCIYTIGQSIKKQLLESRQSSLYGSILVDSKNNVWISLWDGGVWLAKWENGRLKKKHFFSEFDHVKIKIQKIIEDNDGNIWMGGINGIFRFRNGKPLDHYHPLNAAGGPAFITGLTIDEQSKTIWLGDNASGIIRVSYSIQNNVATFQTKGFITDKNGLKDMYVRSLLFDHRKNLWAGTRYGGIFRITENSKGVSVTNETANAKITCARITDINAQDTTAVWFATCDGVYSYNYHTNDWHHYNTGDGLLNAEVFNVFANPGNNSVWALTSQGVTELKLQNTTTTAAPIVNITSIDVLGKTDPAALSLATTKKYSYTQNSVGFHFIAASFMDQKKVLYRYMLEGHDRNWSEPKADNSVDYVSLPPGNYSFKVIAANAKGQWSERPAVFRFEIVMPFYKKSWFLFLLVIIVFSIAYFIRLQQLKSRYKIEKLRLSIARDLHDDVGATLGSINILSKNATRKLEKHTEPQDVYSIFKKIGSSAEDTLEAMDDIVWSINPDKDRLQDLVIRIREYAIPLFEANNISFDFKMEGDLDETLSMNIRRNLFLIFKESIHNILKHSKASHVSILLLIKNQQLQLDITDNGKGFACGSLSNRNGLKNMRQRAESINAHLDIHSNGLGTTIHFSSRIR